MEELSAKGLWPREGTPFQPQEDAENGGGSPSFGRFREAPGGRRPLGS